jgi:hypothetical protein
MAHNHVGNIVSRSRLKYMRSYWVVSPNVDNREASVPGWKNASVAGNAAIMGYDPDDKSHKGIGKKFAHTIAPGDVILIARRRKNRAEPVGFGIVRGKYKTSMSKEVRIPEGSTLCSLRKLRPFIVQKQDPPGIPLIQALGHSMALAQLHPARHDPYYKKAHEALCNWMDNRLKGGETKTDSKTGSSPDNIKTVPFFDSDQLEFTVRTKEQVKTAKRREEALLGGYRSWLEKQGRTLERVEYKKLRCDGYEKQYNNLIEAKSSAEREHIRMAVGQLLDYAFQGKKKFRNPNMGILLPKKPDPDSVGWLRPLKISLIWPENRAFIDNADGQFA